LIAGDAGAAVGALGVIRVGGRAGNRTIAMAHGLGYIVVGANVKTTGIGGAITHLAGLFGNIANQRNRDDRLSFGAFALGNELALFCLNYRTCSSNHQSRQIEARIHHTNSCYSLASDLVYSASEDAEYTSQPFSTHAKCVT
jgi:hypothetical protein